MKVFTFSAMIAQIAEGIMGNVALYDSQLSHYVSQRHFLTQHSGTENK